MPGPHRVKLARDLMRLAARRILAGLQVVGDALGPGAFGRRSYRASVAIADFARCPFPMLAFLAVGPALFFPDLVRAVADFFLVASIHFGLDAVVYCLPIRGPRNGSAA
jgi:hypothetical protein